MKNDACGQGKRKGLHPGSRMEGRGRLVLRVGIMLLAVAVFSGVSFSITQAEDQPTPAMTINYQNGTITAIYQTSFQIDGRTYSLSPDAVILDDSGNELDAGMLAVTLDVKYRIKKGETDKIDRMILFLPR